MIFMPGDRVKYIGANVFDSLDKDGKKSAVTIGARVGEVVAKVQGESNAYVVDFGDDAFILCADNLRKQYFAPGTEPTQQRRRDNDIE